MIGAAQAGLLTSTVVARTYAKLSALADRKSANITRSADGYTAYSAPVSTWVSVYLDIDKTEGVWAFEIYSTATSDGSNYAMPGMRSSLLLDNYIGATANGCCVSPFAQTYYLVNGSVVGAVRSIPTANTRHLIVFDIPNRRVYAASNTNPYPLFSAAAIPGTGQLYLGVSLFDAVVGQNPFTINTGYEAFTAGNIALLQALETTLGVTINRGVWA